MTIFISFNRDSIYNAGAMKAATARGLSEMYGDKLKNALEYTQLVYCTLPDHHYPPCLMNKMYYPEARLPPKGPKLLIPLLWRMVWDRQEGNTAPSGHSLHDTAWHVTNIFSWENQINKLPKGDPKNVASIVLNASHNSWSNLIKSDRQSILIRNW